MNRKFLFGLKYLKSHTPILMRALGTALLYVSGLAAVQELTVGKYSGAVISLVLGGAGKFLSECFTKSDASPAAEDTTQNE